MNTLELPIACFNNECSRYGVQVFSKEDRTCLECQEDMVVVAGVGANGDRPPGLTVIEKKKPANDTFECPPDLEGCPIATKCKVFVPLYLYNQWVFLANQLDTEWIAYLKGERRAANANEYDIRSMYFPEQEANGGHCKPIESVDQVQPGTIAAIHSHVQMNAFFSLEDKQHFNHEVELVVNAKGEIKAVGRIQLNCGRFGRGPADIIFVACEEELKLQEELESKITIKKPEFQSSHHYYST